MGENCGVHGCSLNRRRATKVISFHDIMRIKDQEWRSSLVASLGREFTKEKLKMKSRKHLYICSRHFEEKCIVQGKKCHLVHGSIPTKFLPVALHSNAVKPRKEPSFREPPVVPERVRYLDFEDFRKTTARNVPASWLVVLSSTNEVALWHEAAQLRFQVDAAFNITLKDGIRSTTYDVGLKETGLNTILRQLISSAKCCGMAADQIKSHLTPADVSKIVPLGEQMHASSCSLLATDGGQMCGQCAAFSQVVDARRASADTTLHKNTPLRTASKQQLIDALKTERHSVSKLKKTVKALTKQKKELVSIDDTFHKALTGIMDERNENASEFVQLFWEEQKKMHARTMSGHRWHPMMIRYALLLHSQSPAAYAIIRKSGIMKLPGETTLRAYTNAIHPTVGFNIHVIMEIKKEADKLPPNQNFVTLLHDEMSIKTGLVYDQRSGELVGFLNQPVDELPTIEEDLATHVLVFYVVGINSKLAMSLGFFPTKGVTASMLYSLLWKAVGWLEGICGLKVMISTSDKAPSNQKLVTFHGTHKAVNMYAPDRCLYFMSDVPHLIKTIRNCFESSTNKPKATRHLWNGQSILWDHIVQLYYQDVDNELRRTRLTYEHVKLTSQSRMRVYLAAQVMSATTAAVLKAYGAPGAEKTAEFISLTDRFFDCLNGISLTDNKFDRRGYTSVDDARFKFLDDFLIYLRDWKNLVEAKKAENLTASERNRMFISAPTYNGIRVTVQSFVEVTRYLLQHGCAFVLPRKMCQDPLEEHFGRHRSQQRRCSNPTLYQFGYQENKLRIQRCLALQMPAKGNTRGAKRTTDPVVLSSSPIKRRTTEK